MLPIGWYMSMESSKYLGFVDGASHHTQKLASSTWVIYTPKGQLMSSIGVCLQPSSNNVAKYSAINDIFDDSILNGIRYLEVCLESQLVVLQLNGQYCVRDPTFLRRFTRVILLENHFDFITYIHIPRNHNQVVDSMQITF